MVPFTHAAFFAANSRQKSRDKKGSRAKKSRDKKIALCVSRHLAMGRKICEVGEENGSHHGIPYMAKIVAHFSALCVNWSILRIDNYLIIIIKDWTEEVMKYANTQLKATCWLTHFIGQLHVRKFIFTTLCSHSSNNIKLQAFRFWY